MQAAAIATEAPASSGRPGPGEIMIPSNSGDNACSTVIASLRTNRTLAPATRSVSTSMKVKLSTLSIISSRGVAATRGQPDALTGPPLLRRAGRRNQPLTRRRNCCLVALHPDFGLHRGEELKGIFLRRALLELALNTADQ